LEHGTAKSRTWRTAAQNHSSLDLHSSEPNC